MTAAPLSNVPLTPDLVRGALEVERTDRGLLPHRLPARARLRIPDEQLAMAESQPSGVRLALRTAATALEVDVLPTKRVYVGAPPRPDGVHELVLEGRVVGRASATGGRTLRIDMASGGFERLEGPAATLRFDDLPDGEKDLELWLPHDETTELVALRADAPVGAMPSRGRRTWLHHGSSVSHGSHAATPTGTWPALAAAAAGVDLVNLGFGGGALLDPFVARTVRDTPADVISLKLGLNVVNSDLMRRRAFAPAVHGFLDTVRDGHPTTPLLVVSPVLCPVHEDTPGPLVPDLAGFAEGRIGFLASGDASDATRLTLRRVREDLEQVVAERAGEDPALGYLDGRLLYGEDDAGELPLPDGLHPDAATHRLLGERFARLALGPGGVLGEHSSGVLRGR